MSHTAVIKNGHKSWQICMYWMPRQLREDKSNQLSFFSNWKLYMSFSHPCFLCQNIMRKADFSADSWDFSKSPQWWIWLKVRKRSHTCQFHCQSMSILRLNYISLTFLANSCLTLWDCRPTAAIQKNEFWSSCNSRWICTWLLHDCTCC